MFLSYYISQPSVKDHLEIEKFLNSPFSSVHHSFNTKSLVPIVELYFCRNSPVQFF